MTRAKANRRPGRERVRALPWAMALRVAMVVGKRWRALSREERARVASLLRDSGGRPGNLRPKQRRELRRLAAKLDLKGAGRELIGLAGGSRRGWRRRSRCPVP